MTRIQRARSIRLRGDVYAYLQEYARVVGKPIGRAAQDIVCEHLGIVAPVKGSRDVVRPVTRLRVIEEAARRIREGRRGNVDAPRKAERAKDEVRW